MTVLDDVRPGGGAEEDGVGAAPLVVRLSGSGRPEAEVGGKGAALDRLIGWGLPVPPCAVATAAAYHRYVAHNDLAGPLAAALASPDPDPWAVERLFTTGAMPDDLATAILGAAEGLGPGVTFAVRSSATAEDTGEASFAGQYESDIGVTGHELLTAVKRVWASLWSPAVVAYRRHQGVGDEDLAMAVIVMPVLEAARAGVAFTFDPGGVPGHVRVELVEGLAEGLVSGTETPDVLVVPRERPRRVPEGLGFVDELVDLALDVERADGRPQDVEWVLAGGRVQLVQARPITTTAPGAPADDDGFDTPPLPGVTYTSAGLAEMLPGVLPPLTWTVAGPLLEDGFRQLLDELGVLPADLVGAHGVVGRFRGRAALNLTLLRETAARVPGGSAAEMERQYFGQVVSTGEGEPAVARSGGRLQGVATLTRALRLRRRAADDAEVLVSAARHVAAADVDLAALGDADLLAYLARLEALAARLASAQVRVAAAAAAAYRGLEVLLARQLGEAEAAAAAQRITAGALGATAGAATFPAADLAALLVRHGLASTAAAHDTAEGGLAAIEGRPGGAEVTTAWRRALARSGSMAVFGGPTWAADPDGAWQAVTHHRPVGGRRAGSAGPLAELEADLTGTWRWRAVRIVTGQLVDVRRRLLRRLVADATELLGLREEAKGALLLLGGEAWRATREVGHRLAARGALVEPAHVDLLARTELGALAGEGPVPGRGELERRRRAVARAEADGPLPRRFEGRPDPVHLEGDGQGVLSGWGASPGRRSGRVRVVTDPRRAEVEPGDVLVAVGTDPSWTPLFLRAGAVVVEEGGPLSHAAIIARELGLPAVLNAPGAVQRLRGVERVAVDGSAGTVEVLDPAPDADEPTGDEPAEEEVVAS